jgi:hypothetical protein
MNNTDSGANKNAKHKFDVMCKTRLRRWFLVQTSGEDEDNLELEISELKLLLDDTKDPSGSSSFRGQGA